MKITEHQGLWEKTVEYNYTPTIEELYYYYSGTYGSYNRNNPYAKRYGMTVTKTRYSLVTPTHNRGKESKE